MSEPEERQPGKRRTDPEIRKERVKLLAGGLNAVGIALIIGTMVAPIIDPSRAFDLLRMLFGSTAGVGFVVAALTILRYIKPPER